MYEALLQHLRNYEQYGIDVISSHEAGQIADLLQEYHAEIAMLRRMQPVVLTGESANSFVLSAELSETKVKLEELSKEKEQQEYTILGIMHSVDKWLDGKELEQDEVNRAVTMREKTLRIVEKQEREINSLHKELERMKSIMREHGIMVIPSAIPGGKSSWNVPSKN